MPLICVLIYYAAITDNYNCLNKSISQEDQNMTMTSPTLTLYTALQAAFDHFNARLFGARLPHCLLTLRSASRVYGYHHAGRFISPDGSVLDELRKRIKNQLGWRAMVPEHGSTWPS
jgi:hypothetical protein